MQQSCTTSHRNRLQSLKSKQRQRQQGTGQQSRQKKHAVDSWQPLPGPLQVSKSWMKTNPSGNATGCESPNLLQTRVNNYGFLATVFDSVCTGRGLDRGLTKRFGCPSLDCRFQILIVADLRLRISNVAFKTPPHRSWEGNTDSVTGPLSLSPFRSDCSFTELLIHSGGQ